MATAAQIAANQANSQHSTGPKTEAGKLASSRNHFRHGLSGFFGLLQWENADHYAELLYGLRDEHQPVTPTEALLVERMAQHWWLAQRALRLQGLCFHEHLPMLDQHRTEQELALYLRYQTTHERAFHKCLADLLKLRAQAHREHIGFESQKRQAAAEQRKQELHEARLQVLAPKAKREVANVSAPRNSMPNRGPISPATLPDVDPARPAHPFPEAA